MTELTQSSIYIALVDYQFDWTPHQIQKFINFWNEGMDYRDIARKFRRHQIEVAVLVLDLAEKGVIEQRANGIGGGMVGVVYEHENRRAQE